MLKHNPPNIVWYDQDLDCTVIRVTRRDGVWRDVLMDTWAFVAFPELTLHLKRTRVGRDEFYAAAQFEGKLVYLHRLIAEAPLTIAALAENNIQTTVDHRNRNHCDCRVSNLRAASRKEQRANQTARKQKDQK